MTTDSGRVETEARRLFLRYAQEVVEQLGMCPWAATTRLTGRMQIEVVRGAAPDLDRALACVDEVEHASETDVGVLIFPELDLDRVPFQRFAAALRQADADRRPPGTTVLAMADFHPNAEPDLGAAERLVAFVRRTPDPVIQLVRRSALAAVRMTPDTGTRFVDAAAAWGRGIESMQPQVEPVGERVARANLRTVENLGVDAVRAILDDILADRNRSYRTLGIAAPTWGEPAVTLHTP